MRKLIIIALVGCIVQSASAQFFAETGANAQIVSIEVRKSPALSSISELIILSGGKPGVIFPKKRVRSTSFAPTISIGYRVPTNEIDLSASIGTSQDFDNSLRLGGIVAVKGKNIPYPQAFTAKIRGYKETKSGICFGGEFRFDKQRSKMLLNNSNLDRVTIGLLNQISNDINLLAIGPKRFMQINAIAGWQYTHQRIQFNTFGFVGLAGNALNVQFEAKLRYFFHSIKSI